MFRAGTGVWEIGRSGIATHAAASAWSVAFLDTFTDTDTTLLSDHTPAINLLPGGWAATTNWHVSSNTARLNDAVTYLTYAVVDTGALNYRVTVKVRFASNSTVYRGIVVRHNGLGSQQYNVGLNSSGSVFAILQNATVLASASLSISLATTYTLVAECVDGTITVTLDGGNTLVATEIPTTGRSLVGMSLRFTTDWCDDFQVELLS